MNKSPRQTVKPAQRQAHDTEIGREKERKMEKERKRGEREYYYHN